LPAGKKPPSADDTGYTVESLALPVCALYGIRLFIVHPFGDPAFRAIGKGRGFYKFTGDPELPAMDAEPAVLERFLLLRQALDFAAGCRQDTVFIIHHRISIPIMYSLLIIYTRF
jgi:hypothetical protein